MIRNTLHKANSTAKSYWLKKPAKGFRFLIMASVILILIFLLTLYVKPIYSYIVLTVLVLYFTAVATSILYFGFFHRICTFKEFGNNIEIVDFIKPIDQEQSMRTIKQVGDRYKYGKAYLVADLNRKQNPYLPIVTDFLKSWFGKKFINTLFLGGGAQIVPLYLAVNNKADIEVVEISKKFIKTSINYFYPLFKITDKNKINTFNDDAFNYVFKTTKNYDFIFVDIFVNKKVPEKFYSQKFISRLINKVNKNGFISFNLGIYNYNDTFNIMTKIYSFDRYYSVGFFNYNGSSVCFITNKNNFNKFKRISKNYSGYDITPEKH